MPKSQKSISIQDILAAILLYAAVLVYQGYQYGQSDQSQILPVIYAQDHPGTYASDHYVSHYLASGINERTIFQGLLRYAGYQSPFVVFLWHMVCSIALILAWVRIAGCFIARKWIQWMVIGFVLVVAYHTATGSNEIYYNQLVPSLPAKALASWAIYQWLKGRYYAWSGLLVMSCFLQPLVGLQLFLVTAGGLCIEKIIARSLHTFPWKAVMLYLLPTVPWIYFLAANNGAHDDPQRFINFLQFRLPHHFFASSFSFIDILITGIFLVAGLLFFKDRIKWMIALIITGCIIYETGAEILHSTAILYAQWWKTTLWTEVLGVIAIAAIIDRYAMHNKTRSGKFDLMIPLLLLLVVSLYRFSGIREIQPVYMSPLTSHASDEVDISRQARALTTQSSLFIIPPEITSFRWYAQRDMYVDYKAMLHTEKFLYDWNDRIQAIYGYDMNAKAAGETVFSRARKKFQYPDSVTQSSWREKGITHVITYGKVKSMGTPLGSNENYSIYALSRPIE